jgi:hypothetical protein
MPCENVTHARKKQISLNLVCKFASRGFVQSHLAKRTAWRVKEHTRGDERLRSMCCVQMCRETKPTNKQTNKHHLGI